MVPRQMRETFSPVDPRLVNSIATSIVRGGAARPNGRIYPATTWLRFYEPQGRRRESGLALTECDVILEGAQEWPIPIGQVEVHINPKDVGALGLRRDTEVVTSDRRHGF